MPCLDCGTHLGVSFSEIYQEYLCNECFFDRELDEHSHNDALDFEMMEDCE
jgi:hypothetical protein